VTYNPLAASEKLPILNGSLECSLREYVIFEGDRKEFVRGGGRIGKGEASPASTRASRTGDKRRTSRPGTDRDGRSDGKFSRFGNSGPRREAPQPREQESENPLAKRRNPDALKSIQGRKPTLPPMEGPIMRPRGWKKKN